MAALTDRRMDRMRQVIDILRVLDREIPAQVLTVFFYVASHEGCTTVEMPDAVGLAQSSVSRCTDWLSDYHRLGKPGMGLIIKQIDQHDRRLRRLYLSEKGKVLVSQIKELIYD